MKKTILISALLISVCFLSCNEEDPIDPVQEVPQQSTDSTGGGSDDEEGGSPGNT